MVHGRETKMVQRDDDPYPLCPLSSHVPENLNRCLRVRNMTKSILYWFHGIRIYMGQTSKKTKLRHLWVTKIIQFAHMNTPKITPESSLPHVPHDADHNPAHEGPALNHE